MPSAERGDESLTWGVPEEDIIQVGAKSHEAKPEKPSEVKPEIENEDLKPASAPLPVQVEDSTYKSDASEDRFSKPRGFFGDVRFEKLSPEAETPREPVTSDFAIGERRQPQSRSMAGDASLTWGEEARGEISVEKPKSTSQTRGEEIKEKVKEEVGVDKSKSTSLTWGEEASVEKPKSTSQTWGEEARNDSQTHQARTSTSHTRNQETRSTSQTWGQETKSASQKWGQETKSASQTWGQDTKPAAQTWNREATETCNSSANVAKPSINSSDVMKKTPIAVRSIPAMRGELAGIVQKVVITSGVGGKLSLFNEMADKWSARAIIHTGNFGFYDAESPTRLSPEDLRSVIDGVSEYEDCSMLSNEEMIAKISKKGFLSELPDFISGVKHLKIPVYVVWGEYEDISVIEKLRKGVYHVPNLYIIDHNNSFAISSGSITLRLFGIGGAFSYPHLLDVGQGNDTISGANGKTWTTMLQLGELLKLAERYEDPREIRVFISHLSPSKEPLAHFISTALGAEYTISAGNAGSAGSIFTDASIHTTKSLESYLKPAKDDIISLWNQVYFVCNEKFT